MRIVFAVRDRKNFIGGPAADATRLLPALVARGHDVHALCFWVGKKADHPNIDRLVQAGIPCRIIRRHQYTEDGTRWILEQIREIDPDIFVAGLSTEGCFTARWLRPAGIPVINALFGDDPVNVGRARFFSTCDEVWRASGHAVFGGHLLQKLRVHAPADIPAVSLNGIIEIQQHLAEFSGTGTLSVVYAGRLAESQKRTGDLIQAFIALMIKYDWLSLHLIGDSVLRERTMYTDEVKCHGMQDRIIFHGILHDEAYYRELARHQVLILMSDSEGIPGTVLDGMACGLVPVCLKYPGVSEVIEHDVSGLVIEDRSTSLEAALVTLKNDREEWKRLSTGALAGLRKFEMQETLNAWEHLFARVVGKERRNTSPINIPDLIRLPGPSSFLIEDRRKPTRLARLMRRFFQLSILLLLIGASGCSDNLVRPVDKEDAMTLLLQPYLKAPFKSYHLTTVPDVLTCTSLLGYDGRFRDLRTIEQRITSDLDTYNTIEDSSVIYSEFLWESTFRLWKIAEQYRGMRNFDVTSDEAIVLFGGILHYGSLELNRPGNRFQHRYSDFGLSTAAINIYFCLFPAMEAVRTRASDIKPLQDSVFHTLVNVGLQSWLVPDKQDTTLLPISSIERFQGNTWWITGNALDLKPAYQCALMMRSSEMIDVIAFLVDRAVTNVSHATVDSAFWAEGLTPDGGAWSYGRQNLPWAYSFKGILAALDRMTDFRGTPWHIPMTREKLEILMAFIRQSAFLHYQNFVPPFFDRQNFRVDGLVEKPMPSVHLARKLLSGFRDALTTDEIHQLRQFIQRAEAGQVCGTSQEDLLSCGTHYMYSHDDLVRKTPEYYVYINMASARVDGVESARHLGDYYNFFAADGASVFMRTGNEYQLAFGAFVVTAYPGVTARSGDEHIGPGRNLMGHTSRYNIAAGLVTEDGSCAGFAFQKMRGIDKYTGLADTLYETKQEWLYGVEARKSYFWFGDVLMALGSGISDLRDDLNGEIRTTINQTELRDSVRIGTLVFVDKRDSGVITVKPRRATSSPLVAHQGFAYQILPEQTPGAVHLLLERRKARWDALNMLNRGVTPPSDSIDMFQLWIDHGSQPENDTYGYLVYCNEPVYSRSPHVITNTQEIQAAISFDSTYLQAIFYVADTLHFSNMRISVSNPCALSITIAPGSLTVTVSDATMNPELQAITVSTNIEMHENRLTAGMSRDIGVPVPGGIHRGMQGQQVVNLMITTSQ